MSKKQLPVYATQLDLATIAKEVILVRPIEFAVMGLFDRPELIVLDDADYLKPFTSYLAFDKGLSIAVRSVPQRNGGIKFAVDPMENIHTMVLHIGGHNNHSRLIAGAISVATGSQVGEGIYSLFAKEIRRKFEKIRSYYVGPEALKLFDDGIRLTPTAKSPEAYDLAR